MFAQRMMRVLRGSVVVMATGRWRLVDGVNKSTLDIAAA